MVPTAEPSASDTATAAQPIKIGLLAPFSGVAAGFGQDMLRGAQLAFEEANAAGSINGKRLTIDQGDDKADPSAAGDAAKKLTADGVAAVIGPATSPSTLAVESLFNDAKVPLITPAANDPRITDQKLKFIFRSTGRWDQEPPLLVDALTKQTPGAKIALIADKSTYGQSLAVAARLAITKAGLPQPVLDDSVDAGTKDYGPLVAKLKPLGANAVVYAGYAADGGALVKALRAGGVQAPFAMGDAGQDQALIAAGGSATDGTLLAYPPDPKQVPSAAAFMDGYKRRNGTSASLYAVSTYDTARLLADAIRRAGSTDGEALQGAIAAGSDVSGVYWGKMAFDDKGDLQAKTYALWTVRNARFEQSSQ